MIDVLLLDKSDVGKVFIAICLTGPIAGVILGGLFVQKVIGGYEYKNSSLFIVVQLTIAAVLIIPIYYMDTLFQIALNLWLLMFFGGSTMPIIQGITISSLPPGLRASGNSFCNLMIFALGFTSAPPFYGYIYQLTQSFDKRIAFVATLSISLIGWVAAIVSHFIRSKRFSNPESQESKNLAISTIEVEMKEFRK